MAFEWLFGRRIHNGAWITIPSVVLDIDVVRDVHRLMSDSYTRAVEVASIEPTFPPGTDGLMKIQAMQARTAAIEAAQMLAPKIEISPPVDRLNLGFTFAPVYVDVDALESLGAVERAGISMSGAGVQVSMRRGTKPDVVSKLDEVGHPDGSSELGMRIADLLEASGTRRPQLKRLLWLAPFVFAAVVTGLGVWALVVEAPGVPTVLFVSAVMLAFWVTAIVVHKPIEKKFENSWPGIRFREGSRAALRERLTNTRATAIVALFTTPIAGAFGYILRWIFGG